MGYLIFLDFKSDDIFIGKTPKGKKIMMRDPLFMALAHELIHVTHGKFNSDKITPPTKGRDYHTLEEQKTIEECNVLRKEYGMYLRDNHSGIDEKRLPENLCYYGLYHDLKAWMRKHKCVTKNMLISAAKGDRLQILSYLKQQGGNLKDPEILKVAVVAGSPRVVRELVRLMPIKGLYKLAFEYIDHLPTLRSVVRELGLALKTKKLYLRGSGDLTDDKLQTLLEVNTLDVLDLHYCPRLTIEGKFPLRERGVIILEDELTVAENLRQRRRQWHTKP